MPEISLSANRLRLFISSTIGECAGERAVVKRTIDTTDHSAFIFEDAGARPYPPPQLFLPELDRAHIFIGIYKDSYGWIAPNATTSGLEQEFDRARALGIPRLLYVYRQHDKRDPRLTLMLDSVQGEVTYFLIDDAEDLYRRLKEDVENTIAEKFERVEAVDTTVTLSRATLQTPLDLPDIDLRPALTAEIEELQKTKPLLITGERGSGKSRLLVGLAKRSNGVYISAKGLDRHLLCSVIVNTYRRNAGLLPEYFLTPEGSSEAVLSLWGGDQALRLYIDDCRDERFMSFLIEQGGEVTESRRLVITGKPNIASAKAEVFELAPAPVGEALLYVRRCSGQINLDQRALDEGEFGNPLFLNLWCKYPALRHRQRVEDVDLDLLKELSPACRELVACVALGLESLQLPELSLATARAESEVLDLADEAVHFLRQSETGLQFQHSHQLELVTSALEAEVLRRTYLQRRVARALNKRRAPLRAFKLLNALGDAQSERFASGAMFEAAQRNDFGALLEITKSRLEHQSLVLPSELAHVWLVRAYAERQGGLDTDAWESFAQAEKAAADSGDDSLVKDVEFVRVYEEASKHLNAETMERLIDLVEEVSPGEDTFRRARYSVDLSALYLRLDDADAAIGRAREALQLFVQIQDSYGTAVAQKNLVSALTQSKKHRRAAEESGELQSLLKSLERYRVKTGSIRERAWFCNLQTLRLRTAGRLKEAYGYASEAIDIAEQLGDLRLKGLNQINLGNVLRDRGDLGEAVTQYLQASGVGFRVGDPHLESSASRLASTIYVEQNCLEQALACAQYSVEKVAGTTAIEAYVDALEQLAWVETKLRRAEDSADSYYKAYTNSNVSSSQASRFLLLYLRQSSRASRYPDAVATVTQHNIDASGVADPYRYARWALESYQSLVELANDENLVDLTELHVETAYQRLDETSAAVFFGELLKITASVPSQRTAALSLLALFATIPLSSVGRKVLTDSERNAARTIPDLSFRAGPDGSSHWTVTLSRDKPILIVVQALDSSTGSSVIAVAIVLFLWAFESEVRQDLLAGIDPLQQKVEYRIAHRSQMPDDLSELIPASEDGITMTAQRDYRLEDRFPTLLIHEEKFLAKFVRKEGETPGLLILLGFVLSEFTKKVLSGQIESAETAPKIAQLLRQAFL